MRVDSDLFLDVADALGMGNPAIVEKDYYVVALLKLLCELSFDTHFLVFSGGTALTKSGIKTHRMSEDVDIKIIPKDLTANTSKTKRKKARKALHLQLIAAINSDDYFSVENTPTVFDEYRYQQIDIRYPQAHSKAPCLRPFIKLELIETLLFDNVQSRNISSLVNEVTQQAPEVPLMDFSSIKSTQAEKLVSMLRRTASFARDNRRDDDPALIRHIYDTYYIQHAGLANVQDVVPLVQKVIAEDITRYGNQHLELMAEPIIELKFALNVLQTNSLYETRFNEYVVPMIYGSHKLVWQEAFGVFKSFCKDVLNDVEL